MAKKRSNEEVDNVESGFMTGESVEEAIQRVCTPWWNVPYEEQVKLFAVVPGALKVCNASLS